MLSVTRTFNLFGSSLLSGQLTVEGHRVTGCPQSSLLPKRLNVLKEGKKSIVVYKRLRVEFTWTGHYVSTRV